jgi:putative ABC transport system permease protein
VRFFLTQLVRLFPAEFRYQFGPDMVDQVMADYDRAGARSRYAAALFALLTALDLVRSAVAERWNPTWVRTWEPKTVGEGMMRMTMNGWTKDFGYAIRSLKRSPGFAVVTVMTLGLAIGVNTGIFSVVNAVLLDPLPYPDADRLVHIAASAPGSDMPQEFGISMEFYVQYDEQAELLEDVSLYNGFTATLQVDDRTERLPVAVLSPSAFEIMKVTPILGRLPVPEDENRVALISHALWATWFGSDPSVLGRTYTMADQSRTIIGVMGPDFWFPTAGTMLWLPVTLGEDPVQAGQLGQFGAGLFARMAPAATLGGVTDELTRLALRLPERFGGSPSYARIIQQHRPVVRTLKEEILGSVSAPLWILLGSVGVVLLIACANVANLFLVRAERRQLDLAVRRALGAGRAQLIRGQVAEAMVVAAGAGVVAVFLAWLSVPVFLRVAPQNVPRLDQAGITLPTILFTAGACLLSALLCGVIPAVRSSAPKLTRLREGGRGSTGRRHWGRDGLVVAQTALALVLLIGSGLLVRSFLELRDVDPGYDTENILTFQIAPTGDDLTDAASYARFHMDFMERLAAMPGVESVGVVENVPLDEGARDARFRTESTASEESGGLLGFTFAGGDYFGTMGIELLQGRVFTRADHISELGNVIVAKSAADLLWPGESPLGRTLLRDDMETWGTVVGVVADIRQDGLRVPSRELVYYPLVGAGERDRPVSSPAYVVKSERADVMAPEIRALVREVAPSAPMYRVHTMAGLVADSMVGLSFTMFTLGVVSILAILLGAIGLFGVLSYIVAERTKEIGVRMALGAEALGVQRMVVAQGARVVFLGVIIGVGVAVATTRVLANMLFGVAAADITTFLAMSMTMILVGMLASYLPARRASHVDPVESLRGECSCGGVPPLMESSRASACRLMRAYSWSQYQAPSWLYVTTS